MSESTWKSSTERQQIEYISNNSSAYNDGPLQALAQKGHKVTVEELVLDFLHGRNYTSKEDSCLLQTFEIGTLERVASLGTGLRTIFLAGTSNKTTDELLDEYNALGVHGLGLSKNLLVRRTEGNYVADFNRELVEKIHERSMKVHAYTFRNENHHLNWDFGQDPHSEYEAFVHLGVDGFFTDFPASLRRFLEAHTLKRGMVRTNTGALRTRVNLKTRRPLDQFRWRSALAVLYKSLFQGEFSAVLSLGVPVLAASLSVAWYTLDA